MSGAGYRTFQSGEVLTSTNVQTYLMDQAVQVYSGTAARSSAVPSPSTGMVAYSTATGLQVFNGSAWASVGGATYAAISGGSSTALGTAIGGETYNVHTFTSDANLVVTTAGLIDFLIFGGGGAGGTRTNVDAIGGGGGGGGYATGTIYLAAGTVVVDIGAGGTSATGGSLSSPLITSGFGSSLGTTAGAITAAGGGRGGAAVSGGQIDAQNGGCGGASNNGRSGIGLASINGVTGFNGGTSAAYPVECAAGGGGAGAVGVNTTSGTTGGAGGAGVQVNTFAGGASLFKAGGGGGGGSTGGAGGSSVGGAGGSNAAGSSAAANTAGGGGGGGNSGTVAGGAGGSGIVYVRVKTS